MNEELYGVPDEDVSKKVINEIIAQARAKILHPTAASLLEELINGTTSQLKSGETITVRGLGEGDKECLPSSLSEKLHTLREVINEDYSGIRTKVQEYWQNIVLPRANIDGEEPGFTTDDMKYLFDQVHYDNDPMNESGISIVIHKDAAQLAWDTPSMSVRIGENREAITSVDDMFAKIIHEYVVHGGRARDGLASGLPILGTGVYSAANEGENSDYLTFEEGFASLAEISIDGSFEDWQPVHVSRYLAAITAYRGADFRESFEINWRARLLMSIGSEEKVTDELVNRERKQAYLSVTRLFRGTPTAVKNGPVLTFNKDLAYLNGKISALSFLEKVGNDHDEIRRIMHAKIDPNNKHQYDLMVRFQQGV
jgi:hypothetical protein